MTHQLHRRLRRATGLGAIALLALPLAAQAADRVQLSESFNSGAPGLRPTITMRAAIDNGAGGMPVATGIVRFTVDARHLSSSSWPSLYNAPAGTQLGTMSTEISGSGAVRVISHGTDASGQYVRAGLDVPHSVAAIIGDDQLPIVIRRSASRSQTWFQLDTRSAVGKLTAKSAVATLQNVSFTLRASVVYGGKGHPVTLNPTRDTALTNVVTTRTCAEVTCAALLPASNRGSATVHLPKTVTLAAPVTATYGYRYSIGGTGRSGDVVTLQSLVNTSMPPRGTTMVRPDGTFVIRATLRSLFSDDGDLEMSARGRYAVASVEGGNATVYGVAAQDTHVVLSQPRFVFQRKAGSKLHFSVRVPGGDDHVRLSIKLGAKTLATGYATRSGTFSKTIVKPAERGNLRVVASVPGADTAISKATPLSR